MKTQARVQSRVWRVPDPPALLQRFQPLARAATLALALLGPLAAGPLTRPFAVDHYDVHLVPDFANKTMAGEATLRLTSRIERMDAVELDAGDLQITSVKEGQAVAYFERKEKTVIVVLAPPVFKDQHCTLTIRYSAGPAKGLVFFPDQVYTSSVTSDWMPSDDRADDRATLRLTIDVPPDFKVAASGHPDGAAWVLDTPTPPYLFTFAAGNFSESTKKVNGVTLRVLGKADVFDATTAVMDFLAERTGHGYPFDTYTQVFAKGTVEQVAVGMTILPESYGNNLAQHPDDLWLLAHQMADQWYGIAIPIKDWSDFWLSEGVATFMADAFLEKRFGEARYDSEIASSKRIYDSLRSQGKDRPLFYTDWQSPQEAGGSLPYHKGAWFLAEVRRMLTDEPFWRGLRSYTNARWGSPATSDDMQNAMLHVAAKDVVKNVTKFFQVCVYGEAVSTKKGRGK
jgi:aminopeptidase N